MKCFCKKKEWIVLLLCLLLTGFISCEKDNEEEDSKETTEQAITKEKLIGDWKLVNSTIDVGVIGTDDFAYLKESSASFTADNTYRIIYKKRSGNSSSTTTLSGTYTVNRLNSVTFFNSPSEIELIDNTLQITSTTHDNKIQHDIFIRNDDEEFVSSEEENEINVGDEADGSDTLDNTYDGSAVIDKIQGVWKIVGATDDCLRKNTIEFQTSDLLVFTQHKKKFSRTDLLNYNINVSYPIFGKIRAVVTKGYNTVTFDTEADCGFIKASKLHYTVTDAHTIKINEVPQLNIEIVNDNTINLIYKYVDKNSNEQVIQFSFIKK